MKVYVRIEAILDNVGIMHSLCDGANIQTSSHSQHGRAIRKPPRSKMRGG